MPLSLKKGSYLLLALLLAFINVASSGVLATPARPNAAEASQSNLPDDLVSAFLAASQQPFQSSAEGYTAHAGGLSFSLGANGLQASGTGFSWGLSLSGFGRAAHMTPQAAVEIVQTGMQVEARRAGLTEWYRSTALGVEHGFTIPQAPAGAGPLVLQFDLSGGQVGKVDADGRGLSFALANGRSLRYDSLRAWDASGAALEASLSVDSGQVTLQVNDQNARYPISVDPLVYLEQKIIASGAAGDYFGYSGALEGDTAVIGVYDDTVGANAGQGSAYVFTRSAGKWSVQQILVASDGSANDRFGFSVALSGETAVIGAGSDDVDGKNNQGSAYVFIRSGSVWSEQKKLIASDGAADDYFGKTVALSGDTALVGAHLKNIGAKNNQGAAYVFVRSGTIWSEQKMLTAADGAADDCFGSAVALAGNTAIVGVSLDFVGAVQTGSAYVFTRNITSWTQQQKLIASDGVMGDGFGTSVALSSDGNTALVGAPSAAVGDANGQGAAYVFTRSVSTWSEQKKLTASNGAGNDMFGQSVALSEDGNTALVGAVWDDVGANMNQGSAYAFTRSGTTWTERQQLTASDGDANDNFSLPVALSGDTALVGANWDDMGPGIDQGSAYVFTLSGSSWSQQQKLTGTDGEFEGYFGNAVAISDTTALVGAYYADIGASVNRGAVYVFTLGPGGWSPQQKLTAPDGTSYDYFGGAVALSGDTALIGANNVGLDEGAAYVFVRSAGVWSFQQKLTASDRAEGDHFGNEVALSGNTALIGASLVDVGAKIDQGAAYVFTRSGAVWSEQQKLTAADGAAADQFGGSVALSGDTALVGAALDDIGASADRGSAYVFTRSGTTWSLQQKLLASDGAAEDRFGQAVALSAGDGGNTALIGMYYDTVGLNANQGSAIVFTRSGTVWSEQQKLVATDATANDYFGFDVALSPDGGTALVGDNHKTVGANVHQGAAYLFTRSRSTWTQQQKFTASDGKANDDFGNAAALSDDATTAMIGAYASDFFANTDQGAVYFFDALPVVVGLVRADANPTKAASVDFTIRFSENVTGVRASDFSLTTTGAISGASVTSATSLSNPAAVYTVKVATGTGSGTLRVNVDAKATINDTGGNALTGIPYTSGEAYTVDRTAPSVTSSVRTDPNNTRAASVRFTVTFSESVIGVQAADFSLVTTGAISGAAITGVSGSGAVYTVSVSTGSGGGQIRLDVPITAVIADAAGNLLAPLPYTAGESYTRSYELFLPKTLK